MFQPMCLGPGPFNAAIGNTWRVVRSLNGYCQMIRALTYKIASQIAAASGERLSSTTNRRKHLQTRILFVAGNRRAEENINRLPLCCTKQLNRHI
uniref:Uncharacterized protein n=1 Tax=Kalanchoe fedtschenkoi TaxID=63787 RepID=A0A7N0U1E5_KALFE